MGPPGAPETVALLDVVRGSLRPHLVLATGPGDPGEEATVPLLRERPMHDGPRHRLCLRGVRLPGAGHRAGCSGGRAQMLNAPTS